MKIIFVENENPSRNSSGGIMSYLINLSEYLIKKGFETSLIGVGFLNNNNSLFSNFISVHDSYICSNYNYFISLLIRSLSLKFKKNSIVHCQRSDMLIPFIIRFPKIKSVITLHGKYDFSLKYRRKYLFYYIYAIVQYFSFKRVNYIISVDEKTTKYYLKKYPFIINKIITISTSIKLEKFKPIYKKRVRIKYAFNDYDKILLYIGRLDVEKNIDLIIASFKIVKEKLKDSKLLICGSGSEEARLKYLIQSLNLKDVIFFGEVDHNLINEIISCADVFVFTSKFEGSPIIIKEVLACNVPIVSVDVGDVKRILKNLSDCYIVNYNENEVAEKICLILSNNKKYSFRKYLKQYDDSFIADKTIKIYKKLLM